jgi:quercetin dioxygenase-like cupin family protein
MSEVGSLASLPQDEPYPGVRRRSFDAAGATVASYQFEPGAAFPAHRHPQEQITLIDQGSVRMLIAGEERPLRAGGWSIVAGDVPHGIVAGPDGARITAIIVPRRAHGDAYELVAS